jgi:UDP-glucose 4-epimerase
MSRHVLVEPNVLVVGGAGYIGSHMVRYLMERNYKPVIIDDLSTGHRSFVPGETAFYQGQISDSDLISEIIKQHKIKHVMHFAAKALVAESVADPLLYYRNNTGQTAELLNTCLKNGVKNFVFSSTCSTFGIPSQTPISENAEQKPINPYGASKLMVEKMLKDVCTLNRMSCVALRYFNAAGAHDSGQIGEDHTPETHLIPNLLRASLDKNRTVTIFGNDYPTADGTCVRDYVHVEDLAHAHELALLYIDQNPGYHDFNLGSGHGYSNLEVLKAAEKITGRSISFDFGPRRHGDPPVLVANHSKAHAVLKWQPKRDLENMIATAYRWEVNRIKRD